MGKSITLTDNKDGKLIKKIEEFRKKNEITHFVDAVRRLCEVGLNLEETVRKIK